MSQNDFIDTYAWPDVQLSALVDAIQLLEGDLKARQRCLEIAIELISVEICRISAEKVLNSYQVA